MCRPFRGPRGPDLPPGCRARVPPRALILRRGTEPPPYKGFKSSRSFHRLLPGLLQVGGMIIIVPSRSRARATSGSPFRRRCREAPDSNSDRWWAGSCAKPHAALTSANSRRMQKIRAVAPPTSHSAPTAGQPLQGPVFCGLPATGHSEPPVGARNRPPRTARPGLTVHAAGSLASLGMTDARSQDSTAPPGLTRRPAKAPCP